MLRRQLQGLKWAPPAISNQQQRVHKHEYDLLAWAFPRPAAPAPSHPTPLFLCAGGQQLRQIEMCTQVAEPAAEMRSKIVT